MFQEGAVEIHNIGRACHRRSSDGGHRLVAARRLASRHVAARYLESLKTVRRAWVCNNFTYLFLYFG